MTHNNLMEKEANPIKSEFIKDYELAIVCFEDPINSYMENGSISEKQFGCVVTGVDLSRRRLLCHNIVTYHDNNADPIPVEKFPNPFKDALELWGSEFQKSPKKLFKEKTPKIELLMTRADKLAKFATVMSEQRAITVCINEAARTFLGNDERHQKLAKKIMDYGTKK